MDSRGIAFIWLPWSSGDRTKKPLLPKRAERLSFASPSCCHRHHQRARVRRSIVVGVSTLTLRPMSSMTRWTLQTGGQPLKPSSVLLYPVVLNSPNGVSSARRERLQQACFGYHKGFAYR
jgi:hypothetical protein